MHKGGDELPETAGIDEINAEFAVVDRGILCHRQTASVKTSVADAYLVHKTRPTAPAIDVQCNKKRPQVAHRAGEAYRIGKTVPRSLQLPRLLLGDFGCESYAGDIQIRTIVDQSHINVVLAAVTRDMSGFYRIGWEADRPCEIICSSEWQHRDCSLQFQELRHGL